MEQKPLRFLSEMVLAPSLSLYKKSIAMHRDVLRVAMDFFVAKQLHNITDNFAE
jgi:hypothetical protein